MTIVCRVFLIAWVTFVFYSCGESRNSNGKIEDDAVLSSDPLPSWNDGATKAAIISFVERISDSTHFDYVPVRERIATFDNDGNLWSEQPMYFQLVFALDRIKKLSIDHPDWKDIQPFKAVLEDDLESVLKSGMHELLELVMTTHAGMTSTEFDSIVTNWLNSAKHPRFDRPYNHLIYQPMLELIDYLKMKHFKVFIVSGGGIEFMRVWAPEAYGIPTDNIIGSSIKTVFEYQNGQAVIRRLAEIDFIDDKAGKPIGIHKHIGKKPIFASGNSDGDLQMLQYTDSNELPSFQLYLHHTDAEREYAYDRNSHVGRLDKGLDEAAEKGWTVIDMKKDWKVVFPSEVKREK